MAQSQTVWKTQPLIKAKIWQFPGLSSSVSTRLLWVATSGRRPLASHNLWWHHNPWSPSQLTLCLIILVQERLYQTSKTSKWGLLLKSRATSDLAMISSSLTLTLVKTNSPWPRGPRLSRTMKTTLNLFLKVIYRCLRVQFPDQAAWKHRNLNRNPPLLRCLRDLTWPRSKEEAKVRLARNVNLLKVWVRNTLRLKKLGARMSTLSKRTKKSQKMTTPQSMLQNLLSGTSTQMLMLKVLGLKKAAKISMHHPILKIA